MLNHLLMAAAAVCLLAATGCQERSDTQVRNVLNTMCPAVDVAYAHYQAVASLVSETTQKRVVLAKQQAEMLCAGRATATTVTVLTTGAMVYATVRDALREARASGASVGYAGDLSKLEGILRKAKRSVQ